MKLFDSNIVIYGSKPEYAGLGLLAGARPQIVSAITVVEVLGYHRLTDEDKLAFEEFFSLAHVLPVTNVVIDQAVAIRQRKNIQLGDALLAATALVHGLELYTRNTEDFDGIPGLVCVNPIPDAG